MFYADSLAEEVYIAKIHGENSVWTAKMLAYVESLVSLRFPFKIRSNQELTLNCYFGRLSLMSVLFAKILTSTALNTWNC